MMKKLLYNKRLKCRSVKLKCLILIAIVISVYFILSYKLSTISKNDIENKLELKNVILHLDLKGSPPKISYLLTLLPKLLSLGVTGLLMEYEDMFPYEGELVNLSATNHYNVKELHEFVTLAVQVGLDVIPLVQTFSHMEYALKLNEFQHLRENPHFPDSICPSQAGSQKLITNMLQQVIKFHQNIHTLKYLHIGADEVYHINKCVKCLKRHETNTNIYVNHIDAVLKIVHKTSPSTTVLLWDDMFRKIPLNEWKFASFYNPNVEPVYWKYEPTFKIDHSTLMKYHKKFKNIWIASAFKGADGKSGIFPDWRKRFWNHLSWLKSILDYKFGGENVVYNFSGIILTGWSRYSHMDPLCELLPVAIPSLYLNLLLIKKFKYIDPQFEDDDTNDVFTKYLQEDLMGNLHCTESLNIEYFDSSNCYFAENELINSLKELDTIIKEITNVLSNSDLSSLEYYSKTNYHNMNILEADIQWCNNSINNMNYIKNKLINNLNFYYDSRFIDEYVNYKLYNPMNLTNKYMKILQNMSAIRSWKRRPNN